MCGRICVVTHPEKIARFFRTDSAHSQFFRRTIILFHNFDLKRTSVRAFSDMIWNCTSRTTMYWALRVCVQNTEKMLIVTFLEREVHFLRQVRKASTKEKMEIVVVTKITLSLTRVEAPRKASKDWSKVTVIRVLRVSLYSTLQWNCLAGQESHLTTAKHIETQKTVKPSIRRQTIHSWWIDPHRTSWSFSYV